MKLKTVVIAVAGWVAEVAAKEYAAIFHEDGVLIPGTRKSERVSVAGANARLPPFWDGHG